jgi:hypothetical protein
VSDEIKGREHLVRRHGEMTKVFKRFSVAWRMAFAAARWPDLLDTWMDQCKGIDTDHLEPAAQEFLRTSATTYPPKPWEFAKFARSFSRSRSVSSSRVSHDAEPNGILTNARPFWIERTDADGPYAAECWALAGGGSVGISEREMDRLLAGELRWGWGQAPAKAVA